MQFAAHFECEAHVTPAAAHGFHACAAILMQMLVIEKGGNGPWVDEFYEKLRSHLETEPMPEEQEGFIKPAEWHETAVLALDNVIAHRLLVGDHDIEF